MASDFDARARTWDADPKKVERARTVAEAIARQIELRRDASLLDFGCGTGLLGFELMPMVKEVTFADASGEMLAVVREKLAAAGAQGAVVQIDPSGGALPAAPHDVICTLMTLHHVPDVDGALRGFHDALRPRGALCIVDLDAEDGAFHGAGFQGHNGFDRGALGRQLERAGFEDVRFSTVYEIAKETAVGPRRFPLFLAVTRRRA